MFSIFCISFFIEEHRLSYSDLSLSTESEKLHEYSEEVSDIVVFLSSFPQPHKRSVDTHNNSNIFFHF